MSEPIQAISQGNYILHNIDAKKLYVQEPLFTANSGDAVYVGWRPDETVLWSGACLKQGDAAVSLSESASNFEKIEIYAVPNPSTSFNFPQVFTYLGDNTKGAYMCPFMTTDGVKGKFAVGIWTITNGTSFNLVQAGQTDSYPTVGWNDAYGGVVKIVGINRKENA